MDGPGVGPVDDLGVAQHRLELPDPGRVQALIVLGRVVVGVLLEVAELPGALDAICDLPFQGPGAVFELFDQAGVRGRRELGGFHRGEGIRGTVNPESSGGAGC